MQRQLLFGFVLSVKNFKMTNKSLPRKLNPRKLNPGLIQDMAESKKHKPVREKVRHVSKLTNVYNKDITEKQVADRFNANRRAAMHGIKAKLTPQTNKQLPKMVTVATRIPEELHARLKSAAFHEHETMSLFIAGALDEALDCRDIANEPSYYSGKTRENQEHLHGNYRPEAPKDTMNTW